MDEILYRVLVLVRFVAFLGVVYLALHILVAQLSTKPGSKLLGFFELVTAPLTRPVRAWVAPGAAERTVRSLALALAALLWLAAAAASWLLKAPAG